VRWERVKEDWRSTRESKEEGNDLMASRWSGMLPSQGKVRVEEEYLSSVRI